MAETEKTGTGPGGTGSPVTAEPNISPVRLNIVIVGYDTFNS